MRAIRRSLACRIAASFMVAAVFGPLPIGSPAAAQMAAVSPRRASRIAEYVAEASQRFGVPQTWIYAIMGVESAGDIDATSVKGAIGLMQVMPATYADLRTRYGFGPNAYDARDNILAGTAYLREMYDRYGSPGFLAAYNAGPGRYQDHLAGRALPTETRAYLARLSPAIGGSATVATVVRADPLDWTRVGLFAGRWGTGDPALLPTPQSPPADLSPDMPAAQFIPLARPAGGLFVALSGERR